MKQLIPQRRVVSFKLLVLKLLIEYSVFGQSITNLVLKNIDLLFHLLARLSLILSVPLPFLCKLGDGKIHSTLQTFFRQLPCSLNKKVGPLRQSYPCAMLTCYSIESYSSSYPLHCGYL